GGQVQIGVFLGVVEVDVDHAIHVVFQPGAGDGRALGADHLAVQVVLVGLEVHRLGCDELQLVGVVVVGEVDGVLALFGDRHGGGEEVELAGVQRGNDAIPVGGHHFAFHFHLGAQRVGDIQVETDGRAAGIDQVEGRVGAFGADAQFLR